MKNLRLKNDFFQQSWVANEDRGWVGVGLQFWGENPDHGWLGVFFS